MTPSNSTASSTARAARILIIDDDIYTSEMYATNLRSAGYQVDIADNGIDGYARMHQQAYDVVLLDIMLPQLNGNDILRQWRTTSPKGSKPPIIILTNCEQDSQSKAKMMASSDAYVIKASTTPSRLREIIAQAIVF